MVKQLKIFENELADFKKDNNILGVLLTGSVAYGTATDTSDLDIVCLCNKDNFVSKYVDDILVEIHFNTFETMMQRIETNPIEAYRYIFSKIQYDNGQLNEIISYAQNIYNNYSTPLREKENIVYWLSSTKIKLYSALKEKNELKISYYLSTNTWKVLEGIWAINNKPMPPSSLAFFNHKTLVNTPSQNWFIRLLTDDVISRGYYMCELIDWITNKLKK